MVESLAFVGIFIPGTVIVIAAGFAAATGVWQLTPLIIAVTGGAIVGDGISYLLGRVVARSAKTRHSVILQSSYFFRARTFFYHYGGGSVFLGRFIGPVRPVIPFVAGFVRMSRWRFALWNILSAIIYSLALILGGFFFGHAWSALTTWSTRGMVVGVIVVVCIIILWILYRAVVRHIRTALRFLRGIVRAAIKGICKSEEMRRLSQRCPWVWQWLRARWDRTHFWGRTATLLGIALLYIAALLGGVVESVVRSEPIVVMDTRLHHLFVSLRTPESVAVFWWITYWGKSVVVATMALVLAALLWFRRSFDVLLGMSVALVGAATTTTLGKMVFARERPPFMLYPEDSLSFPSGHATLAAVFYGFLAYIMWRLFRRYSQKVAAVFVCAGVIILVALSRMVLGVHYFSDVWAGILVGLLYAVIGMSISEWYRSRYPVFGTARPIRWWMSIPAALVVLVVYVVMVRTHPVPSVRLPLPPTTTPILSLDTLFAIPQLRYAETLSGARQAPLSFIILARDDALLHTAFARAGWTGADAVTLKTLWRTARAAITDSPYPRAPMTPSFWNTRVHDFGFQKETDTRSVRQRHHARFWRTAYHTPDNDTIYVGTASLDTGIKWGVTHTIDPAIDVEREVILSDLHASGMVCDVRTYRMTPPTLGKNFGGDAFFTDGRAYVVRLCNP